ncbi:unnamed protein product [Aphanomyces euteiches]
MCSIQAYLLDVFMIQSVLWNGCMAFNLLRMVVHRDSDEKLQKRFWVYFFVTGYFSIIWGASAALPIWSSGWSNRVERNSTARAKRPPSSMFGPSRFYCWIERPKLVMYHYAPFVILVLLFLLYVVVKVRKVVIARARRVSTLQESSDVVHQIQRRLMIFVVAFLCLYTPPLVYRLLEFLSDFFEARDAKPFDRTLFMQVFGIVSQILLNLQGFVIAAIYRGFQPASTKPRKNSMSSVDLPSSVFLEDVHSASSHSLPATDNDEAVTIFASTFNMAEGAVPSGKQFDEWIPRGHDVYVIGVQECMNLPSFRQSLSTHLRKINGKVFVEYGREIGRTETRLGYHGHIAITVLVSVQHVQHGHFYMHLEATSKINRGKSLIGLGRASNKGAVGFAFRLFNLTFAVVSCHLASDRSGKSAIKKRHRDGTNILTGMHLQSIDNEFDCHLMAHHTIFMGDLNYRLSVKEASPNRILNMITAVVKNSQDNSAMKRGQVFTHSQLHSTGSQEESALDHDNDRSVYHLANSPAASFIPRIRALRAPSQESKDSTDGLDSTFSDNLSFTDVSWKSLLDHDELHHSMTDGVIFHEFDEAKISFAPTYRRAVGTMLDIVSTTPWTVAQTNELYTTILKSGEKRVPSYTDRILFHSLPGVRDRLACVQYTSAECVDTSDHKPVSCVFEVLVDKDVPRRPDLMNIEDPPREIQSLKLLTVQFSKVTLTWGAALEKFVSEDDDDEDDDSNESRHGLAPPADSNATDMTASIASSRPAFLRGILGISAPLDLLLQLDGLRLRSVFPLPCEDEFAEERKLAEIANFLHQTEQPRKHMPSWKVSAWSHVADNGLKQSVVLSKLRRQLHVALNFVLPSGGPAGQCVVSLADPAIRHGRRVDFTATLSIGGRRTGELSGKVSLTIDKML